MSTLTNADAREELYDFLDSWILQKGLTDLHTHLKGMGSADFWVSRIIETYLPRLLKEKNATDVYYPLSTILQASGFENPNLPCVSKFESGLDISVFEARFLDGFEGNQLNLKNIFAKTIKIGGKEEICMANETLVNMLKIEDVKCNRKGPLRALVRNWFEFLGSNGQTAHHTEVLQTYRGHFSPAFYPQRFIMKDSIVEAHPEVLSILLNTTHARYARSGVQYIEYSVSCGDLLDRKKFLALIEGRPLPKNLAPKKRVMTRNSTTTAPQLDPQPVDVLGQVQCPVLPDKEVGKYKRTWRHHLSYSVKPRNQNSYFLAAFNRTCNNMVYHTIKSGVWTSENHPQPLNARDAYSQLSDIACNLHELGQFIIKSKDTAASMPKYFNKWAEITQSNNDPAARLNGEIFKQLCESGEICEYLQAAAERLCADYVLESVYKPCFSSENHLSKIRKGLHNEDGGSFVRDYVPVVAGLDWVGDELGHPFCIFSHDKFIDLVATWMTYNPKFGVRIHAGEGPIRPSTLDGPTSPVRLGFYLHMYIVCESIKLYHRKLVLALNVAGRSDLKVNMRIGHGVAFLFGCQATTGKGTDVIAGAGGASSSSQKEPTDHFVEYLCEFRKFLKDHDIVCELNPTSNHMLLPSTFHSDQYLENRPTLHTFLQEGLPVVLGTDDDGIWAIHKCKRHYHHVSVAAEYCQAIECGDITSKDELLKMFEWGRSSAFAAPKPKPTGATSSATKRKRGTSVYDEEEESDENST